jgi:hypothetical protein
VVRRLPRAVLQYHPQKSKNKKSYCRRKSLNTVGCDLNIGLEEPGLRGG